MRTSDTTRGVAAVQRTIFARMTGGERVMAAMEMAEQARQVTLEGIRHRHPELDEQEVHLEWLRLLHGPEVLAKITSRK